MGFGLCFTFRCWSILFYTCKIIPFSFLPVSQLMRSNRRSKLLLKRRSRLLLLKEKRRSRLLLLLKKKRRSRLLLKKKRRSRLLLLKRRQRNRQQLLKRSRLLLMSRRRNGELLKPPQFSPAKNLRPPSHPPNQLEPTPTVRKIVHTCIFTPVLSPLQFYFTHLLTHISFLPLFFLSISCCEFERQWRAF